MTTTLPPPRAELAVRDHADGGLAVEDPVTGHRTHLGPESAAVFVALAAGHDTAAGLCAAVPRLDPGTVRDRLRQIGDALLLDDDRWRAQRELFAGPAPALDGPVRLDPALRHRCVRCGSSCLNVDIGPIGDATLAAIDAHRLWRGDAESAAELVHTRVTAAGVVRVFDHDRGACVMLDGDACALHAVAGEAAKPAGCRQFPYTFTAGPDGVDVGLQLECRSALAAAAAGAAVEAEALAAELGALVTGGAAGARRPAAVAVGPGLFVAARRYLDWWQGARDAGLATVIAGAITLAEARAAELAGTRGWLDPARWPAAARAVDRRTLDEALPTELLGACAWLSREAAHRGALVEQEQADLVRKATLVAQGAVRLTPTAPAAEAEALWSIALRGALADHRLVLELDLLQGVGRLVLWRRLADALARLRAAQASRRPVHGQDMNDALVITHRVLRAPPVEQTLRAAHAAVRALLAPPGPLPDWIGVPAPHLVGPTPVEARF
ncbi:MAG: hypothetical protein H6701_03065 [Myxococcales bacterium]|nr:hypothetical protein [Myxococcales bacterium]